MSTVISICILIAVSAGLLAGYKAVVRRMFTAPGSVHNKAPWVRDGAGWHGDADPSE